jgi:hypothetical protein
MAELTAPITTTDDFDMARSNRWAKRFFFFFLREEMHLRIQLPGGSWYVGLRGARRDYPLKPHGGRNMMILRESGVEKQVAQSTLEDVGHSKSAYGM